MTYSNATPAEVRALIRAGKLTAPTTGYCDGYAQGNLVVLPKALAWDFLLFCQRNPKACPLLEVADAGERSFSQFAPGSDIARDIPRYRIYKDGVLTEETTDVTHYFEERSDLVSFLIGCSFSFESALLEADIPVRQIEEGVNVPMYNTNIPCTPAGVFSGNMVVRLRRRCHHPPGRNAGVLALRGHAASRGHALQTDVLHHPRAGAYVHHRCKKYRAQILKGAMQCRPLI